MVDLAIEVHQATERQGVLPKLRFVVYRGKLKKGDRERGERECSRVTWLDEE